MRKFSVSIMFVIFLLLKFLFKIFRYRVTTNLSSRVGHFNSSWRDAEKSEDIDMTNFRKAMELVRCEFLQKLHFYATDWWEALQIVVSAVENRFEVLL